MKFLIVAACLLALAAADVSHLLNGELHDHHHHHHHEHHEHHEHDEHHEHHHEVKHGHGYSYEAPRKPFELPKPTYLPPVPPPAPTYLPPTTTTPRPPPPPPSTYLPPPPPTPKPIYLPPRQRPSPVIIDLPHEHGYHYDAPPNNPFIF